VKRVLRQIDLTGTPATTVPQIEQQVYATPSYAYLAANCHTVMHAVGRAYAREHRLTLAKLQDVLPRSNDPTCSAGFAHGMITYLGPQVLSAGPKGALAICTRLKTRYATYTCVHGLGHAYMRTYNEYLAPSLAACRALGATAAPDCAQGAFHDYWFSISGADNTRKQATAETSPRGLCTKQAPEFVKPCWYRAFLESPKQPTVRDAADIEKLCAGLAGVNRSGCVTAASLVSTESPYDQMAVCATLHAPDAASCVHGVRVASLLGYGLAYQLRLAAACGGIDPAARLDCYAWIGRTLAVVTNGAFGRTGCPRLKDPGRTACEAGARRIDEALVTFS
jgi:hypothetical protein